MSLLEWQDLYSVGIDAVDHEHKELIELINRLHAELMKPGSRPDVVAFLGDVLRGISAHFALEERFMSEHRYDQLKEHKADHEALLDELRDLMEAADARAPMDDHELAARLNTWFSKHFQSYDARLHHMLGQHPQ